jgi:hypothetical protein
MPTDDIKTPPPDLLPVATLPLQMSYAPLQRSKNRAVWVIVAGLFTTALTLFGVGALQVYGQYNLMGLYANYVIPAGAMIVGLLASSGYAIASWKLGVKIRAKLLAWIVLLMVGSYFAAEYVQFVSLGPLGIPVATRQVGTGTATKTITTIRRLGFWEHYHLRAVNWTWKKENSTEKDSSPLGMAGYFFVLLGIVGFAVSGLIIPFAVGQKPYCELCERYMTTRPLAVWPAMMAPRKISKKDVEALALQQSANTAALQEASARLERLVAAAQANDVLAAQKEIGQTPAERKAAEKELRRLAINLTSCPLCATGWLQPQWRASHGKKLAVTKIADLPVTQDFVRGITPPTS